VQYPLDLNELMQRVASKWLAAVNITYVEVHIHRNTEALNLLNTLACCSSYSARAPLHRKALLFLSGFTCNRICSCISQSRETAHLENWEKLREIENKRDDCSPFFLVTNGRWNSWVQICVWGGVVYCNLLDLLEACPLIEFDFLLLRRSWRLSIINARVTMWAKTFVMD